MFIVLRALLLPMTNWELITVEHGVSCPPMIAWQQFYIVVISSVLGRLYGLEHVLLNTRERMISHGVCVAWLFFCAIK